MRRTLSPRQPGEDVELGEGDGGHPVEARGVPDGRAVEPAAPAGSTRRRPVFLPRSRIICPSSSKSSVGKGPPPTRVAYALETPTTALIFVGPTPDPVHTPPAVVFEEVTNG